MSDTQRETEPGIRVGVLIIGSLFWDSKPHRQTWRCERLDIAAAQRVRAPIRYGRQSQKSRGGSYTMVFSPRLIAEDKLGIARVVPCRHAVGGAAGIVDEALRLWTAETRNGSNSDRRISASWGCVALVEHPERPLSDEVRRDWAGQVASEGCDYGQLQLAEGEKPVVDRQSGLLNIPWPTPVDGTDLPCDVLLATATDPTIEGGDYPSVRQIADAWNTRDGREHVNYFYNNRKKGIETFQDGEIEERLRELSR